MEQSKIIQFKEFVVSNFSLVLFLPLLFGGMNQVYNLATISPNLLRFFSPTQAISDGVYLLTLIAYDCLCVFSLLFVLVTLYIFITNYDPSCKLSPSVRDLEKKYTSMGLVFEVIMLAFGITVYWLLFSIVPNTLDILASQALFYAFSPLLVFINYLIAVNLLNINQHFNRVKQTVRVKDTFGIVFLLTIFASMMILNISSHNLDIYNFKFIVQKYEALYPGNNAEILYFNDQYIFIGIGKGYQFIEILKIDTLLEDSLLNTHGDLKWELVKTTRK